MAKRVGKTSKRTRPTSASKQKIVKRRATSKTPVSEKKPDARKGEYAVGRGKPPIHTQFRKGDGRKRPGRTPGSKNLRTIIMEAVNDPVTVTIEGKQRRISKLQATAMQLATKAATGNDRAIAKLLDWVAEIEARAELARPSEFPFSEEDIKVIKAIYGRLRSNDERARD